MARRKPKPLRVLCLDPGVRSTGWAFWEALSLKTLAPTEYGVWRAPASMGWQASCRRVSGEAAEWYQRRAGDYAEPDKIVCEWPQLWSGSAKSQTAADRDSLAKMWFLIGRLQEAFETVGYADDMTLVTPQQWKAQASKRIIIARLKRWTGVTFRDHVADAVGIGAHLLGRLP